MSRHEALSELERLRLDRRLLEQLCNRWDKEGIAKMDVSIIRSFVTRR